MSDSTFLFANPSFVEGASRVLDLAGAIDDYNRSLTPRQADIIALRSDWSLIGSDFREAIEQVKSKARKA